MMKLISRLATVSSLLRGAIAVRRYVRERRKQRAVEGDEMEITTADGEVLVCRRVSEEKAQQAAGDGAASSNEQPSRMATTDA